MGKNSEVKSCIRAAILFLIAAVFLSACISMPKSSASKKGSPSGASEKSADVKPVNVKAQADVSQFGVKTAELKGQYSGIYHCGNTTTQFVLNIKDTLSTSLTGSVDRTNIQFNNRGGRAKSETTTTSVTGSYDEKSGTLEFRVDAPDRRNIHRHNQSSAWLYGVILPDAKTFVLFDKSPMSWQCSNWIAKRGKKFPGQWEYLEEEANQYQTLGMFDRLELNRERSKDSRKSTCDKKLLAWLKQAEELPPQRRSRDVSHIRIMYSDKHFVPYFGKPFHKLEKVDREVYATRLSGSCSRDRDAMRLGNGIASQMAQSFQARSYIVDIDKAISAIAYNTIDKWMNLAGKHVEAMAENTDDPGRVKSLLSRMTPVLDKLFLQDKERFLADANTQYRKMIIPKLQRDLETELAAELSGMNAVENLASFEERSISRYPDVDRSALTALNQRVKAKVNQAIVPAAQLMADTARGIGGINNLDTWRASFTHSAAMVNKEEAARIEGIFKRRRQAIAAEILKGEQARYQREVAGRKADAHTLRAGVSFEGRFVSAYRPLVDLPEYVAFKAQRRKLRDQQLQDAFNDMSQLIDGQANGPAVRQIEAKYLMASDRQNPAGQQIFKKMEARLAVVAPFGEDKFAEYLNALYVYDYKTLRQMDKESIGPTVQAMKGIMPQMKAFGTLMKFFSGGVIPGEKMMEVMDKKMEQASLIYPIMAFYILNYEKYHAACLEPTAEKRTVQYRWTEYETNGYGYRREIASGGSDTDYWVNPRFLHIFEVIYRSDGDNAIGKFADRFFKGENKIYQDQLIDGTRRLMQRDCKGEVIKAMEPQMIRYFDDVKGRMDAVTQEVFSR